MKDISFRKIKEEDTDKIINWRNSKIVMNNFIYRKRLTKKDHINWLNTKVAKKEVHQFIFTDELNGVDFGTTYIKNIDKNHKKAEIGIFIGEKDYLGKGYGTAMISKTVDFAFKKLSLNKIYARVLSYNKPSYYMFKKVGFHEDALLRDDVIIDNKPYNVYILSLLKKEWLISKNNN